jgi:tRNA A-37 threonylcarbamoyl transferase component Bud32
VSAAGPSAPGRVLAGRYQLDALIARGGMAEVWAATDRVLGRPVAVKLLHPHLADDVELRERFHHEAIAAARLSHPAIVATFDTCNDAGTEGIVMELVRGRTLRQYLDERGHLDPVEVVHIGAEVASALSCAHRAGIVHRDVKPANILLSDDGRVLVTDFGIAKVLDHADVTRTSTVLGTTKYLAPEQVEGAPVDARTDVWALGAVLYECATGVAPYTADNPTALALARLQRDPVPASTVRPGVPLPLEAVLTRAMRRAPDQRYATSDALRAALLGTRLEVDDDLTIASSLTTTLAVDDASAAAPGPPVVAAVPPVATPGPWPAGDRAPTRTQPPRRRPTTGLVVALLIAAALVVTALLVASTGIGRDLFSSDDDTTTPPAGDAPAVDTDAVAIVAVTAYDPEGSGGGENDELAALAADGDPVTEWRSETYASRAFGNLKSGVGLVAEVAPSSDLSAVRVVSPVTGWAAEVYVADTPGTALADWGPPVGSTGDAPGTVDIPLSDASGSWVLVWFVDLGTSGNRIAVGELTVAS